MSTAFDVSIFLSHYMYKLHTMTPFTDALLLMKDCGNSCDASMIARFSSSTEVKLR